MEYRSLITSAAPKRARVAYIVFPKSPWMWETALAALSACSGFQIPMSGHVWCIYQKRPSTFPPLCTLPSHSTCFGCMQQTDCPCRTNAASCQTTDGPSGSLHKEEIRSFPPGFTTSTICVPIYPKVLTATGRYKNLQHQPQN